METDGKEQVNFLNKELKLLKGTKLEIGWKILLLPFLSAIDNSLSCRSCDSEFNYGKG